MRRLICLMLAVSACSGKKARHESPPATGPTPPAVAPRPTHFVERRLGVLPANMTREDRRAIAWSGDGSTVAWIEHDPDGKRMRAVVNGQPGRWFIEVRDLEIARDDVTPIYVAKDADGEHVVVCEHAGETLEHALILHDMDWTAPHFAVLARHGFRDERLVVDGVPGPDVDDVDIMHLDWLPDGRPVYTAKRGGRFHSVVGGELGPDYASLSASHPSASGRVAFVAFDDDHQHARVIVDGTPGAPYDDVDGLRIGPAGTVVYEGTRGTKRYAVVGDRELGPYDRVMDPVFSRAGDRVAFSARRGDNWFVVVDGVEGPPFIGVGESLTAATFSEDGRHVAYVANLERQVGGRAMVVRDGASGDAWDDVRDLTFSADGTHLAFEAERGHDHLVVVDGEPGPAFADVGSLRFGEHGTIYYEARGDRAWCIVQGTTPSCFDDVGVPGMIAGDDPLNFTLDPTGRHVAFRAAKDGHWMIVVDGAENPAADELWPPIFSADGTQVGYGARIGDELWWKVAPVR
jgi:hypothetical protein